MMSSCSSIGVEQLTNDPRSKGSNPVSVDTRKEEIAFKKSYICRGPFVRLNPFSLIFKLIGQEPVAMSQW